MHINLFLCFRWQRAPCAAHRADDNAPDGIYILYTHPRRCKLLVPTTGNRHIVRTFNFIAIRNIFDFGFELKCVFLWVTPGARPPTARHMFMIYPNTAGNLFNPLFFYTFTNIMCWLLAASDASVRWTRCTMWYMCERIHRRRASFHFNLFNRIIFFLFCRHRRRHTHTHTCHFPRFAMICNGRDTITIARIEKSPRGRRKS